VTERLAYFVFLTVVFGTLMAITIALVAILVVLVKRDRQASRHE
jgi:hypothetical protein